MSTKVDHLENFPTFYNMQSVSSNAVYNAIGGGSLRFKDITFTIANMQFNHVTIDGRNFWYCSIPKANYFTSNQRLVSAMIIYWAGISPIIAQVDGEEQSLSFQYWDNHFGSTANIIVRYLYIET